MRPGVPLFTERTPRVAAARRLTRRARRDDERRFLAEGPQAVREALAVPPGRPGAVEALFGTPAALERHASLAGRAAEAGVAVSAVNDAGMAGLSETVSPQGLVAVCSFLDVPLAAVLGAPADGVPPAGVLGAPPEDVPPATAPGALPAAVLGATADGGVAGRGALPDGARGGPPRLVAVLAEIRDPGNAGTVLRTADAAGARAVVFTDASVDPYNGKCVRASAGSIFHPAIVRGGAAAEVVAALRAAGLRVLAADGAGECDLDQLADDGTLAAPTAWLFGNEARGLPDELAALADARVAIPIHGGAESLNLAAAAAVCLYASARAQR
jgi:TrmH family RNA methyltransferase